MVVVVLVVVVVMVVLVVVEPPLRAGVHRRLVPLGWSAKVPNWSVTVTGPGKGFRQMSE